MTRRTKKVGISGKFGPRFGVKIRRRVNELETRQKKSHICPECHYRAVKRKSTGIWNCKHCGYMFTGGAYLPTTAVGESRKETLRYTRDIAAKEQTNNKPETTKATKAMEKEVKKEK